MEVLHSEDVASRTGPGPCACRREVVGEALVRGGAGRVFSSEIADILGADAMGLVEGNTRPPASARAVGPSGVVDPVHVPKSSARNPGDPTVDRGRMAVAVSIGNPRGARR
jgi:hypothetical protein